MPKSDDMKSGYGKFKERLKERIAAQDLKHQQRFEIPVAKPQPSILPKQEGDSQ